VAEVCRDLCVSPSPDHNRTIHDHVGFLALWRPQASFLITERSLNKDFSYLRKWQKIFSKNGSAATIIANL